MSNKKKYIIGLVLILVLVGLSVFLFLSKDKVVIDDNNKEIINNINEDSDDTSPDGYEWTFCSNIQLRLLKPKSWYKTEETAGSTEACFITKESFEGNGQFITGLSINMVKDVELTTGLAPLEYVFNFITQLNKIYSGNGVIPIKNGEDFEGYSTLVTINKGSDSINSIYRALASRDSDNIYIYWYEGPEDEWDDSSLTGDMILDSILLELK